MFIIQEKLISTQVFAEKFVCNLNACKGACCWEGDFGAPLENEEIDTLNTILPKVLPYLSEDSQKRIRENGVATWFKETGEYGTTLMENGACAFLTFESGGIAKCGIEKAHDAGDIDFKKPISCHLYPIRVNKKEDVGFEALNYDEWDICSAACSLGEQLKVPVFRFVKEAIIRNYGEDFYEEMEGIYDNFHKEL